MNLEWGRYFRMEKLINMENQMLFQIERKINELPEEQSRRYYRNFPFIIMLES